jgi:hypothetical protein
LVGTIFIVGIVASTLATTTWVVNIPVASGLATVDGKVDP